MARGRQLRVYLHPDDRLAIDAFVRYELGAALLMERSRDRDGFEVEDSRSGGMKRLLTPRRFLRELSPRHIEATDEWILNVANDPLIEWVLSRLYNGLLYPGRFYYLQRLDSGADQQHDLVKTADRLFRWVRSQTLAVETEWGSERLGAMAAELVRDGQVSLRFGPPGSRI